MVPLRPYFWQRINGLAEVRKAKLAEVDLEYVLGVGGFDLERLVARKYYVHVTIHGCLRMANRNDHCFCQFSFSVEFL
jgi:hypothetical protein